MEIWLKFLWIIYNCIYGSGSYDLNEFDLFKMDNFGFVKFLWFLIIYGIVCIECLIYYN